MIYLLLGDNSYARDQALAALTIEKIPEKFDGEVLEVRNLPDLFLGQSLFFEQRLIVIKNASSNAAVWSELAAYLGKVPAETTVILTEAKPDKRTKTYKVLQKLATVQEFSLPKNSREAEQFVLSEAKSRALDLSPALAARLVARVGLEPWELVHALQKLAMLGPISEHAIDTVIEQTPAASAFELFEAALRGDSQLIQQLVSQLSLSEDGHRTFGLLSGQVMQLAALVTAKSDATIAKDIGVHPFALGKLKPLARRVGRTELRRIVSFFADADDRIKMGTEPWLAIETALQQTAAHR